MMRCKIECVKEIAGFSGIRELQAEVKDRMEMIERRGRRVCVWIIRYYLRVLIGDFVLKKSK